MNASVWLIAFVTLCYVGVSLNEAWNKHWAMSLVYAGYALANIGLIILVENPT